MRERLRRLPPLYPFAIVLLPTLGIAALNPGENDGGELLVVGLASLGFCLVLFAVAGLVLSRRAPPRLVSLAVFALLVWFFTYRPAHQLLDRLTGGRVGHWALIPLGLAVTLAAFRWLARRPRRLGAVSRFLAITSTVLLLWFGGRVVFSLVRARQRIADSAFARELARPIGQRPDASPRARGPRRDVYLIVLDQYANAGVLEEYFGYSNRAFEDSLRALGFTIPRVVHSNYPQTLLSLPSLLNGTHLTPLAAEVGAGSRDRSFPLWLVENNRVFRYFERQGYTTLFFPSRWWPGTRDNRHADLVFDAWPGFRLGWALARSELRAHLADLTLLGYLVPRDPAFYAEHQRRTVAALAEVPARPEPTFAFAHLMMPHPPFLVDRACRPLPSAALDDGLLRTASTAKGPYLEQLQCVNRRLLTLVRTLLERSAVTPIILLQGDHASSSQPFLTVPDARAITPSQVRERFGAFGAYLLPDGGDAVFRDTVSVVNLMPKVLGYYFGAHLPEQPNDRYISVNRRPYDFVRVGPPAPVSPAPAGRTD